MPTDDLCRAGCGKAIQSHEGYITALGGRYHKACFACCLCSKNLAAMSSFSERQGKPCCSSCAQGEGAGAAKTGGTKAGSRSKSTIAKTSVTCHKCRQTITASEGYLTANDHYFHASCFVCSGKSCNKSLEGSFVFKDGRFLCNGCADPQLQRAKELDKVGHVHVVYITSMLFPGFSSSSKSKKRWNLLSFAS